MFFAACCRISLAVWQCVRDFCGMSFFFWIFCGLIFDGWVQVIGFDSLWTVGGLSCGGFAGCWD
jgi:hypothetical protein